MHTTTIKAREWFQTRGGQVHFIDPAGAEWRLPANQVSVSGNVVTAPDRFRRERSIRLALQRGL